MPKGKRPGGRSCGSCVWFARKNSASEVGQCLRLPPVICAGGSKWGWPGTSETRWCGEWSDAGAEDLMDALRDPRMGRFGDEPTDHPTRVRFSAVDEIDEF